MHKTLWVLQWVFGVIFIASGIIHLALPDGLPAQMEWMYDLGEGLHYITGLAEILGGLGLILPGLTKIRAELTPLAASGLAMLMVGAAIWHMPRGEIQNSVQNLVFAAVMAYVAYARWKKEPLPG